MKGQTQGKLNLPPLLLLCYRRWFSVCCWDQIKSLFNPVNVMYALVAGGILLIVAEIFKAEEGAGYWS